MHTRSRRGDAAELGTALIRAATPADAAAIARIYNHYVEHSVVTFEEAAVGADEMARRLRTVFDAGLPWLVAELDGAVAGYAYADKWKMRSAYRHSVESTVYLAPQKTGGGLGSSLYRALLDTLRTARVHAVIGGIALPNDASIALHERLGFVKIGQFDQVGRKFDRWIDVGYWQLLLTVAEPLS
jgi:phosphinothricin acetyltransferase